MPAEESKPIPAKQPTKGAAHHLQLRAELTAQSEMLIEEGRKLLEKTRELIKKSDELIRRRS